MRISPKLAKRKAKAMAVLKKIGLLLVVAYFLLVAWAYYDRNNQKIANLLEQRSQAKVISQLRTQENERLSERADIDELHRLVNEYRVANGLKPTVLDERLNKSASDKCDDMVKYNYWAHNTPEGNEPFIFIDRYLEYISAGENLANGFYTAEDVIHGWKISPGHNENMLDVKWTHSGYGLCDYKEGQIRKAGTPIVVQHFAEL